MLSELLLVFCLAVVLVLVLWCLMGVLLLPVFGHEMVTFCYSKGGGTALEHRVRAYGWLRDGKLSGGRFVIVDCGLDARGLELAQTLQKRWEWVEYCPRPALEDYISLMEH